jgi:hypothetical protein
MDRWSENHRKAEADYFRTRLLNSPGRGLEVEILQKGWLVCQTAEYLAILLDGTLGAESVLARSSVGPLEGGRETPRVNRDPNVCTYLGLAPNGFALFRCQDDAHVLPPNRVGRVCLGNGSPVN